MSLEPAVRKVTRLGQSVLRERCRELTKEEITSLDIQRLILEMAATMEEYEGVGIAANQVGEGLRIFLMGLDAGAKRYPEGIEPAVVINPSVNFMSEETELDWEGCLSCPGLRGEVPRFKKLELSGLDEKGQPFIRIYEGFPARVVQHELDHLDGKVYLDRMEGLATLSYTSRV